ncbi:MAG TPA: thiamine pyrophosphate-binding protein [Burkholderiales bacterium]|nr:thiamine pyrophosphate-binding protein [Burkholderiales bacterium]
MTGPIEAPVPGKKSPAFGSDAVAAMLRALDLPYIALNPGASFRGLHDSLVNYLGNEKPQMLLCLHEESAVAIAHGYAKASGRMMGVALHSNVGLMHASMAIFNAWCDRVPMLILGATGPWDAAKRRPWIDWIHTSSDQAALVRGYTKWDNQPGSIPAACEALLRAAQLSNTAPRAPVYVNLDAALQESPFEDFELPDIERFKAAGAVLPSDSSLQSAVELLNKAKTPAILAGRGRRTEAAWQARIALAEKLQARVFTDIRAGAAFPMDHPLHAAPPATFLDEASKKLLRGADVVLSLDWIDTAGMLKQAWGREPIGAKVVLVSPDAHLHRGWSMDYQGLPPADAYLMCEPDVAVPLLAERLGKKSSSFKRTTPAKASHDTLNIGMLAEAFNQAAAGKDICLTHLPLGWNGAYRDFKHPLDYLGGNGGGGVGAGPGITVGAGLALKGSKRIAVGIVGDGDFLMGVTALWTAVHYEIPCLLIVANNRSFYNDELHQERVAKERGRPVENKWIGQRIAEPDIDLAMMAGAQGAFGIGPVTEVSELKTSFAKAIGEAQNGAVCVVDVRVTPGYESK